MANFWICLRNCFWFSFSILKRKLMVWRI